MRVTYIDFASLMLSLQLAQILCLYLSPPSSEMIIIIYLLMLIVHFTPAYFKLVSNIFIIHFEYLLCSLILHGEFHVHHRIPNEMHQ